MPSQSMTTSKESSFYLLFYSREVLKCFTENALHSFLGLSGN